MPYTILKFDQEQATIGDQIRDVFVASVRQEGVEQPFRIVVENMESKEAAIGEVQAWIAAREKEDADRLVNEAKDAEARKKAEMLDSLNASI